MLAATFSRRVEPPALQGMRKGLTPCGFQSDTWKEVFASRAQLGALRPLRIGEIVKRPLLRSLAWSVVVALLPLSLQAQQSDEEKIQEALGAAPPGVTENAAILDWPAEEGGDFRVLREGSNGWTCLPDQPGDLRDNYEPMCNDAVWMAWIKTVVMAGETPQVDGLGVSYMLNSEWATSNTDPSARGPSPENEWVEGGAHIMLVVPEPAMLDHFPDDPSPDHPYVMYKGTPLVHLMIPMEEVVSDGGR